MRSRCVVHNLTLRLELFLDNPWEFNSWRGRVKTQLTGDRNSALPPQPNSVQWPYAKEGWRFAWPCACSGWAFPRVLLFDELRSSA